MENNIDKKYTYDAYIRCVKNTCIGVNPDTGLAFVKPDFKYHLTMLGMEPNKCELELTWEDIYIILKCETKLWNQQESQAGKLLTQVVDFLSDSIEKILSDIKEEQFAKISEREKILQDINS